MTKKEFFEFLKERYDGIDYHIPATVGTDSGAGGKALEIGVKLYFNNVRGLAVSKQGTTDTRKKLNGKTTSFEIKSGGSVVGNENGFTIKGDYVYYVPCYFDNINVELLGYVVPMDEFKAILIENKITRYCKSSAMCKQPKELQYNNQYSIHSNKVYKLMKILDDMGYPNLEQFING